MMNEVTLLVAASNEEKNLNGDPNLRTKPAQWQKTAATGEHTAPRVHGVDLHGWNAHMWWLTAVWSGSVAAVAVAVPSIGNMVSIVSHTQ